jgi:hypothetical protein
MWSPVQAAVSEGEPVVTEAEVKDATPSDDEGPGRGKPSVFTNVSDYAVKDATAGGKVLCAWMRANIKRKGWPQYVDEFRRALQWITRQEYSQEVKQVGKIPPGLTLPKVIEYCRSESIAEGMETDTSRALKNWFARWRSVLLPDPMIRAKSVELAGKLLNATVVPWALLANAPYLNRLTPCILSTGRAVAEVVETLAGDLEIRSLRAREQLSTEEISEALRYAAAALREGIPPALD